MLLKCKLLISVNCSTSHVINHNSFHGQHGSFLLFFWLLFPTSLTLFLRRFPFPSEESVCGGELCHGLVRNVIVRHIIYS